MTNIGANCLISKIDSHVYYFTQSKFSFYLCFTDHFKIYTNDIASLAWLEAVQMRCCQSERDRFDIFSWGNIFLGSPFPHTVKQSKMMHTKDPKLLLTSSTAYDGQGYVKPGIVPLQNIHSAYILLFTFEIEYYYCYALMAIEVVSTLLITYIFVDN